MSLNTATLFTMSVPSTYGYVLLGACVLPFVTGMMLSTAVMDGRKRLDIQYPNLYGVPGVHKHADEFNRIQRGHQNYLEGLPLYIALTLVGGLKHPIACAVGSVLYAVGAILYQKGYVDISKDVKSARHSKGGPIKYIGLFTSLISTIKLAYDMITTA